ncbi:MAG: rubrerythrin-like domain-containing protein [Haloferacaceae archaeon]
MVRSDSYTPPEEQQFECIDCLERVVSEDDVRVCPECGSRMQNVSLPRE